MMGSAFVENFESSPLSKEDINMIGSTNLSVSEKHHLRMLLHCLECFKSMPNEEKTGLIPEKEVWLEWCLQNPIMFEDDDFVQVLLEQFSGAAIQLEKLSNTLEVSPLDLTLKDLINAYMA
tara:strand:+ start:873 stop:1235 length:363 start_codon:yes stop_codon:yes gene_type:complete